MALADQATEALNDPRASGTTSCCGRPEVRLTARITRRVAPNAPRTRLCRGLSLIQASGHPFNLSYEPVKTAVHDMAAAPGFRETLRALEKRQFEDGAAITVPVTVAFGSRDRVLLPGVARRRDQLPTRPAGSPCPAAGMSRCSTTPQPPPTCCCVPAIPPPPTRSVNPSGRLARPGSSGRGDGRWAAALR